MLKLATDKHEASRGLSATAELLVVILYCTLVIKGIWLEHKSLSIDKHGNGEQKHDTSLETCQLTMQVSVSTKYGTPQ